MMMRNWVSKRLSYALSVWAGSLAILFGCLDGRTLSVVFVRSAVCFLLFGLFGYLAGWVIYRVVVQPATEREPVNDNEEGEENGRTVEGL